MNAVDAHVVELAVSLLRSDLDERAALGEQCRCTPPGHEDPTTGEGSSDQCATHAAIGLLQPTHYFAAAPLPW